MNAVDTFVFYDDVNYIKQGWINRNKILLSGREHRFTLQLRGASSFKRINEVEVGNNRGKLLKTFIQAYVKAPFFKDVEPLLLSVFQCSYPNLSEYIVNTHKDIMKFLGIATHILLSSEIEKDNELRGQDKVLAICKRLEATRYINSIGWHDLYSKVDSASVGIELQFIEPNAIKYAQFSNPFVPWLSIVDVLMFNSLDQVRCLLGEYKLV